jgi:RNA polymerase-binding transcription factor DksA
MPAAGAAKGSAKGKPSPAAATSTPKKPPAAPTKPAKPEAKAPSKSEPKAPAKNDGKQSAKPEAQAKGGNAKPSAAPKSATGGKPGATNKPAATNKLGASKPAAAPSSKPPTGTAAKPAAAKETEAAGGDKKAPRKGITIVNPKPAKKPKAPPVQFPSLGGPLIGPGSPVRKPLIASGPNAPPPNASLASDGGKPKKSPFDKRQLAKFKAILLRKRAELAGDVATMENEALMGQSGSLSHLPQHMAEQGSDAYGQSLSLDLAAADRRLIREIDDALARIEAGTYGICELTGKPIRAERLEELPWARYSIEAARELERRSTMP